MFNQQQYTISQWVSSGGNFYTGKAQISEYAADGPWQVNTVLVTDSANNFEFLQQGTDFIGFSLCDHPNSLRIVSGTVLQDNGQAARLIAVFMIKQNLLDSTIFAMRVATTDTFGNYTFYSEKRDSIIYLKALLTIRFIQSTTEPTTILPRSLHQR